jgi:protein-S-isoprenylcysteine O-methyltransferase Ste14
VFHRGLGFLVCLAVGAAGPFLLSGWRLQGILHPLGPVVGPILILVGVGVVLASFWGAPEAAAPPPRIVASGLYRYVRSPMYLGVVACIVGQGVMLGSRRLLAYGIVVLVSLHAFVVKYEEPALGARLGRLYCRYWSDVSRWWPTVRPWRE